MNWKMVFKSISLGGKRAGSYDMTNGTIIHPPKGSGKKSPKVKGKGRSSK